MTSSFSPSPCCSPSAAPPRPPLKKELTLFSVSFTSCRTNAGISTLPFLAVLMALMHSWCVGESSFVPAPVFVAGTEGWARPDAGPVQCLRSPAAPGLRAWLPEPMDVLCAGCSPPSLFSSPSSPLSFSSLETSLISALSSTHPSSPPHLVSPLCCCDFTFSLAFSQLFHLSPALPLLCYFPCLCCDWLAICVHQSLPGLHPHCHVWAQSLSSCLQLCPSHISGNLNLWSAGIIGFHSWGLQDCRPFSPKCDCCLEEETQENKLFINL